MSNLQAAVFAIAFMMALSGLGIIVMSLVCSVVKGKSVAFYTSQMFCGVVLMFVAFMIFLGVS
ncbi:MAG: hypothetical protein ACN6OP_22470 [Pseudomonadales bacterium]